VTATAFPEDELIPDDWMVLDELLELDDVDESSPLVEVDAFVDEDDDAAVPGIVCSPTTAKTPTPINAAIELPTVSFCSRRSASSRDRARARVLLVGSMTDSLATGAESYLGAG
jgi:hypothetical protein